MRPLISALRRHGEVFARDDDGQDIVEYALLLAFISLAAVGVLTNLSRNFSTVWNSVSNALSDAVRVTG